MDRLRMNISEHRRNIRCDSRIYNTLFIIIMNDVKRFVNENVSHRLTGMLWMIRFYRLAIAGLSSNIRVEPPEEQQFDND